jgi:hypothetical protein
LKQAKLFDMETGVKLSHTTSKKVGMSFESRLSDQAKGIFYDCKTGGWF